MSTVQEIKSAINKLSLEERAELMADLCLWADDEWDSQMKRDVRAGKLANLNNDADAATSSGQTRPLGDILSES